MQSHTPSDDARSAREALSVDAVLITEELERRPSRAPDHAAEARAYAALAETLATNPSGVLETLVELVMELCAAGSAGVSILEPGVDGAPEVFRWHALAGAYAPFADGTMLRDASPCGVVIARNQVLLFDEPARFFPNPNEVEPRTFEHLLAPWHVNGEPIGTVWAVAHTPERQFDAEDARLLVNLSRFAAAAWQTTQALAEATTTQEVLEQRVIASTAAVHESAARLQSLFDTMRQGVAIMELVRDESGAIVDTRYLELNPAFETLIGFDRSLAVGRRTSEVFPEYFRSWQASLEAVSGPEGPVAVEHYIPETGRWFSFYFAPFGGGDGFVAFYDDITERKQAEAALVLLGDIGVALENLTDVAQTMTGVCAQIAAHFGLSHCVFGEIDAAAENGTSVFGWHRDDVPMALDAYALGDFLTPALLQTTRTGNPLVVDDVATDARLDASQFRAFGIGSFVAVPIVRDGVWRFWLGFHRSEASRWSADEIDLMRELTARIWTRLERARAEEALRESEAKYRALFDSMDEAFAVVEVLADGSGAWSDLLFLEVNPAFVRHTAMEHPVGRRATELFGTPNPSWVQLCGQVVESGESVRVEEREPSLDRIFDFSIFRLGDADSRRVAILFTDITERKAAEASLRASEDRQVFLLHLSDALRAEPDADAATNRALQMLADQLQLDRCYVGMYRLEDDRADLTHQVGNERIPPVPASIRLSDFPEALRIAQDRSLVIEDVATMPGLSDMDRRSVSALGMVSLMAASLRRGPHNPQWTMVALSAVPRRWTPDEVALLEEVTERTWAAVERVRAEEAMRESEEQYRTLFEVMGQGYADIELLRDASGRAVDQRYNQFNPAFERLFGIPVAEAQGRTASDVFPDLEPWWHEAFDRIAMRGAPERFEHAFAALERWFEIHAYPRGGDRLAVLYEDVTERKRAEEALRASEERQVFLLALSDMLRPLEDPDEIMAAVSEFVGTYFQVGRCGYAELPPPYDYLVVTHDWSDGEMQSLQGAWPLASFGETVIAQYRSGETVVFEDVFDDDRVRGYEAGTVAEGMVRSSISVPLVKGGQWVASFYVQNPVARRWTPGEVTLMEDVAERTWAAVERARVTAALNASEERFQQFAAATSDVLWVRDAETMQFELVSPAFEVSYGVSREQVLAGNDLHNWAALIHPDDRTGALAALERVRAGEQVTHEFRIIRPSDGELRWLRNTDFPLRTDAGIVERIGGIATDVTERIWIEEELRASEERQAFLVRLGDALHALVDPMEIKRAAARVLREELAAMRVVYGDLLDADTVEFGAGDAAPGIPRPAGSLSLSTFKAALADELRAGQIVATDDVASDPAFSGAERTAHATLGTVAWAKAPLVKDGQLVAVLAAHFAESHAWTVDELWLIAETAERTRAAVERAYVEDALRTSEERHRLIVESARDYAIITADTSGRITGWSPGAEAIFGWVAAAALGQPAAMTFTPEDRAAGMPEQELGTAAATGSADDVRWHQRQDGRRVFIEGVTRALYDEQGAVLGFLKIGQDVTARRQIEQALYESEARFRAVAELVPDLLWSQDTRGVADWYNQRWHEYTGTRAEDVSGANWLDAVHPDEQSAARVDFDDARRTGQALRQEQRIRRHDGSYRWFLVHVIPVQDEAGVTSRWFGAATDIHEQRAARDELEARVQDATIELRALSRQLLEVQEQERRFLANELHDEIGQALTGLNFTLSMAGRGDAEGHIARAAELSQALLEQVRQLSLDLRPPVLDDMGLLPALVALVERMQARTGITIDLRRQGVDRRYAPEIETTAYRVVQEALTNSVRHAQTGEASVQVLTDGTITIWVSDAGVGFDPDAVRASRTSTGLTGMAERVRLVGGSLQIESAPGEGTTVIIELPADAQELPAPALGGW